VGLGEWGSSLGRKAIIWKVPATLRDSSLEAPFGQIYKL
jgi:hypothetical protein